VERSESVDAVGIATNSTIFTFVNVFAGQAIIAELESGVFVTIHVRAAVDENTWSIIDDSCHTVTASADTWSSTVNIRIGTLVFRSVVITGWLTHIRSTGVKNFAQRTFDIWYKWDHLPQVVVFNNHEWLCVVWIVDTSTVGFSPLIHESLSSRSVLSLWNNHGFIRRKVDASSEIAPGSLELCTSLEVDCNVKNIKLKAIGKITVKRIFGHRNKLALWIMLESAEILLYKLEYGWSVQLSTDTCVGGS
jgi:hypothetical protein